MGHHDLPRPDARPDDADVRAAIDALVGPGLRRAFPLPVDGHAGDDRFRALLDTLARRRAVAIP